MPGNCYTEALPSRLKKYFVILFLLLTRGHFITASKSGEYPHRKNRALRLTAETPWFHFWENPKPLFILKCTQVFALAIEISHPHH